MGSSARRRAGGAGCRQARTTAADEFSRWFSRPRFDIVAIVAKLLSHCVGVESLAGLSPTHTGRSASSPLRQNHAAVHHIRFVLGLLVPRWFAGSASVSVGGDRHREHPLFIDHWDRGGGGDEPVFVRRRASARAASWAARSGSGRRRPCNDAAALGPRADGRSGHASPTRARRAGWKRAQDVRLGANLARTGSASQT